MHGLFTCSDGYNGWFGLDCRTTNAFSSLSDVWGHEWWAMRFCSSLMHRNILESCATFMLLKRYQICLGVFIMQVMMLLLAFLEEATMTVTFMHLKCQLGNGCSCSLLGTLQKEGGVMQLVRSSCCWLCIRTNTQGHYTWKALLWELSLTHSKGESL